MISHSMGTIRKFCQSGCFLQGGRLSYYEDVEAAIEAYTRSQE